MTGGTGTTAQLNRDITTSFSLDPTTTTTYYFSVLVSALNNGTVSDALYFPRLLLDGSSTPVINFGIGGNGKIRINIGSSTEGSTVLVKGSSFATATQYLAVGKLELNPSGINDVFSFSLFDASSTVPLTEPVTWGVTRSQDMSGAIGGFAFASAGDAGTVNVDNFYFGTDYLSVITPVPEPSAAVLGLAAGLALVTGRRRLRRA